MPAIKTYSIVICKEPSLPGYIICDKTVQHDFEMAKDAIEGYAAVLVEEGEVIPE